MANEYEQIMKKQYQSEGWVVLTKGWPDFLMYRLNAAGKPEIKAVEIKSSSDRIGPHQNHVHKVLACAGLHVAVTHENYEASIIPEPDEIASLVKYGHTFGF